MDTEFSHIASVSFWANSCLISRAEATGSYGSTKPDRHIPYSSGSGGLRRRSTLGVCSTCGGSVEQFTDLERAVLNAICDAQPGIAKTLRELLTTARLSERDNTGHGFYTAFDVDKSAQPLDVPQRLLDGPNGAVTIGDATLLMGFILWLEDGYPSCLEGFQYCTPDGGSIDLKTVDLNGIRWLRLMSDSD